MSFSTTSTGLQQRVRTGLAMVIAGLAKTYAETADKTAFENAANLARAVVEEGAVLKVMANPPAKVNLVALLASGARTATTSSADQTNVDGRGVAVYVNLTVFGASANPVLTLERKNPDATYTAVLTMSAITATGLYCAILDPLVGTTLAGVDQCVDAVLPQTWRITVTPGNATSCTYSVTAYVIR